MNEQSNVATVQAMYAAFNRGDIPGVMSALDDSIVFTILGPPEMPLGGVRRGRQGMAQFFTELADTLEFTTFDPHGYIAQGDRVVALVHYAGKNKNTGRSFDAESAMLWEIHDGKVVHFVEYTDTEQFTRIAQSAVAGAD